MNQNPNAERLFEEVSRLSELAKASSIFEYETTGEPPHRFCLRFKGRGIRRCASVSDDVEFTDFHECELKIPQRFPEQEPDLRWLTPVFHPYVSFSGFISLADIGLSWNETMGFDVVAERLWDTARMVDLDLEKATNIAAKNWFESKSTLTLPLDQRELRNIRHQPASNIVRYQRRGGGKPIATPEQQADVFYIGEETASTEHVGADSEIVEGVGAEALGPEESAPSRTKFKNTTAEVEQAIPLPSRIVPKPRHNDDDIFFIGD